MAQNKTERVMVRLSPKQAELIRASAERQGEKVSTWLRQMALQQARADRSDCSTPRAA